MIFDADGLSIAFGHFSGSDLKGDFQGELSFLRSKGLTVTYQVLKPDFFVISTGDPSLESYFRYHVGPSGVTGFYVMWKPNGSSNGKRLATLMSDLFRAAALGQLRAPPTPTPLDDAAARPPSTEGRQGGGDNQPQRDAQEESSGSGFVVSASGHVLTNSHVVEGCKTISVTSPGGSPTAARIVAQDRTNDLALLQTSEHPTELPAFRAGVKVGESIAVYGFPLSGILATTGNFTVGNVTATAGLGDDSRMLQISSPVQPGNSGGPLLDQAGNIVGVVVAKLNALKLAAITQDVTQNVNFAIKAAVAQSFLETNGISIATPPSAEHLAPEDLAAKAKAISTFIHCNAPTSIQEANTGPSQGSCSGKLVRNDGHVLIRDGRESICTFRDGDEQEILATCSEGNYCEVTGLIDLCKDSGECVEVTKITNVSR